jgi:tetratricopeptide (TPR) repeat protein
VRPAPARAPEALSPEALDTYAFLVYAYGLNNEDESALAAAAPLMARARIPAGVWLEGGVWLVSRKSPVAVPYLEEALRAWPEDMSLNLLHAEALADQGQAARGVALMRDYLKNRPDSLDARLELALLLVKDKQFTEAEALLNAIPEQQRTPLVDYYHARAPSWAMDRPEAAIPYLQKAVKKTPDFVEALAELAFVYEQRGNLTAARAAYEKLLKLDFSPQDVLLRLIHISLRLNQPERALKYMRQGPDNAPFKLTVASMLMDSRHYLQAERLLKQLAAQGRRAR